MRRQTVLIVDDEPLNLRVLSEALKKRHDVKVATSGTRALQIARSGEPPDLILLDVMMPDMNGHQVCRILKASDQTRNIPIIFVTARDDVADEARGFEIGAVDYISKPVQLPIVRARVRTHLELKRRTELLAELTATDALTGIANRRKLDEVLDAEWRRCARNQEPLSMLLLDVDFFKQYNDFYGHSSGDDCLRQIAGAAAQSVLRPGDLAARYGGEEFAVVLPATDAPGALRVAERLRGQIEALAIPHEMSGVSSVVTVSVGAATLRPLRGQGAVQELVDASDAALYMAKRTGRNRVAPSPEPTGAP